jgi:hypothetical protein
MNMPGFTAEASLYNTREHYRAETLPADLQYLDKVIPQYWCRRLLQQCISGDDPRGGTCALWLRYC